VNGSLRVVERNVRCEIARRNGYCEKLGAKGRRVLSSYLKKYVPQIACILVQIALTLALSFCMEMESFTE
jgi:hypothetical protein